MDKTKINYTVDFFIALSFIVTAISGFLLFFFMPDGVQRGGYQQFLGLIKKDWLAMHDYSGIIMVILVVVHFVLHWNWIVCMSKGIFSRKNKKCK